MPEETVNDVISLPHESSETQVGLLQEALSDVTRQLLQREDEGWLKWFGSTNSQRGLELDELKKASETIRESMLGKPIIKRASQLRATYVWSKGIRVPGVEKVERAGAPTALYKFYHDRTNQESLFSTTAQMEMERAACSDGTFLLLGDNATKKTHRVPFAQITGFLVNPDFDDEVWAYRRQWSSAAPDGSSQDNDVWYYTDRFTGTRPATISVGPNKRVKVDKTKTLFDQAFNRQVGWPLGTPDLLPAISWANRYHSFLVGGQQMTEALARFAFRVAAKTQAGANNVGVKMAGAGNKSGQTAVGSNELTPLSTAGKGYEFDSGRALAAQVATAAEVSIVHLLSDPGAAGSSYGSASNLDLPTQTAMLARQALWIDFLKRVFRWVTPNSEVDVRFEPISDVDPYRAAQSATLAWSSGLFTAEEIRTRMIEDIGITPASSTAKAPSGVLIPNNAKSLARRDIDTDSSGGTADAATAAQAGTPGQGQSTGAGRGDNLNDTRSDVLANAMTHDVLDRMQALVERLEAAKNS